MKSYLMQIVGAVLISVFTDISLPAKWSKYTKIITGMIIISTIASPLENIFNFNLNTEMIPQEEININSEQYSISLIKKELENAIENDIKQRMLEEFEKDIQAKVSADINNENKISGILSINLIGDVNNIMVNRIKEIYAPKEVLINGF